jgi:hypothetical protein
VALDYIAASGNPWHDQVFLQGIRGKAVHRVAAEGFSPEQAVDEAITRITQITRGIRQMPAGLTWQGSQTDPAIAIPSRRHM